MSEYSVGYIIDTDTLRLYGRLSLMILKLKKLSFSVYSHDEQYSCLIINGTFHQQMECFCIINDLCTLPLNRDDRSTCVLYVYIPELLLPMLIGKNGFAVDLLRKCMQCILKIHPPDNTYQRLQLVSFTGDKTEVIKAYELLLLRILCLIPSSGWVYQDSHRMKFICDQVNPHFIFGSSEVFTTALQAGWSLIPPIEQPRTINPFQTLPRISLDDCYAGATFILPNAQIGCLIGPHGSVIGYIRTTSLAEISIEKVYERSSSRVITLRGSLQQVYIALSLISKRLNQSSY